MILLVFSRVFHINCDCAGKFFSTTVHCLFDPCFEAVALLFSKIYVNISQNPQVFREKTYAGMDELVMERRVRDQLLMNKQSEGHMTQSYQSEGGYVPRDDSQYDNNIWHKTCQAWL